MIRRLLQKKFRVHALTKDEYTAKKANQQALKRKMIFYVLLIAVCVLKY